MLNVSNITISRWENGAQEPCAKIMRIHDAIVIVERVLHLMEQRYTNSKDAAVQAMKNVESSLVDTTLIFVAIFVPMVFMGGIRGQIYRQYIIAAMISFAVVCSTIVAFTLSPQCVRLLYIYA